MIALADHLSIGTLIRTFWGRITITWGLTLIETALFAVLPLMIGQSIDGLLNDNWTPFTQLILILLVLLCVAAGRRIYDTRAYGTMRVELGKAQAERGKDDPVSVINARVSMGREMVDFLEDTAPTSMTALVQVLVSVGILLSFHGNLAISAGGALVLMLTIYGVFSRRFFRLNSALNEVAEGQVHRLEGRDPKAIAKHFLGLRREEVRLSDTESLVYGLIFAVLLTMLAYNLWFAATRLGSTPGQIFSVVAYSQEFLQAAVQLPFALQALTRLSEITERINRSTSEILEDSQ
ncbi:MAG: hypothetical protein CSA85_00015 [Alphaproteobacteria bacterium]|nr:MAG: hypothetical protein CSA85_00015 [Alphaproteobacteria bacterium]